MQCYLLAALLKYPLSGLDSLSVSIASSPSPVQLFNRPHPSRFSMNEALAGQYITLTARWQGKGLFYWLVHYLKQSCSPNALRIYYYLNYKPRVRAACATLPTSQWPKSSSPTLGAKIVARLAWWPSENGLFPSLTKVQLCGKAYIQVQIPLKD